MEEAWRESRAAFVIPRCGGRRGHPVLMRGGLVGEMLALGEGATARDLVHARLTETVYVDVEDRRVGMDLDTPGDYEALKREELP
jgi:molybdenum cofactor cytidylyltransferase